MNGHGRERRKEKVELAHTSQRQAHAFLRWPSPVYSARTASLLFLDILSSVAFIPFRSFFPAAAQQGQRSRERWNAGVHTRRFFPSLAHAEQKQKSNAQEEAQTHREKWVKSFFWHEPKTPKRLSSSTSVNLFTLKLLYNIIKLLRNLIILPITPINAVMVLIAINSIATSEG